MRVCDRFNQPLHPGLKSTTLGQNGNHYLRAKVSTVVEIASQDQGKSWLIFSARTVVLSSSDLSAAQIAQRHSRSSAHPKLISSASQTHLKRISSAAQAKLSLAQRAQRISSASQAHAKRSSSHLSATKRGSALLSAASAAQRITSASQAHLSAF